MFQTALTALVLATSPALEAPANPNPGRANCSENRWSTATAASPEQPRTRAEKPKKKRRGQRRRAERRAERQQETKRRPTWRERRRDRRRRPNLGESAENDQQQAETQARYRAEHDIKGHVDPRIGRFEGVGWVTGHGQAPTCEPRRRMTLTADASAYENGITYRVRAWR